MIVLVLRLCSQSLVRNNRSHCGVSLGKILIPLHSASFTKEMSPYDCKTVDLDLLKHQLKQNIKCVADLAGHIWEIDIQ